MEPTAARGGVPTPPPAARLETAFLPGLLFLIGLTGFWLAGKIEYVAREGQIGPNFWPRLIMGLLMVTAAGLLLGTLRAAADQQAEAETNWRSLGLGALLVLGYIVGSILIGFFLSTILFMYTFLHLTGFRGWRMAALSVGTSVTLVYLFVAVVYVSLPPGVGLFDQLTTLIYTALGIY